MATPGRSSGGNASLILLVLSPDRHGVGGGAGAGRDVGASGGGRCLVGAGWMSPAAFLGGSRTKSLKSPPLWPAAPDPSNVGWSQRHRPPGTGGGCPARSRQTPSSSATATATPGGSSGIDRRFRPSLTSRNRKEEDVRAPPDSLVGAPQLPAMKRAPVRLRPACRIWMIMIDRPTRSRSVVTSPLVSHR
jgi:hypothetical protein